jgi:hypothetical protein
LDHQPKEIDVGFNRYGETDEEEQARHQAMVDHTAWTRRLIVDGDMTLAEWSERERRREQYRGDATTEVDVIAQWDRTYPHNRPGKPSPDTRLGFRGDKPRSDPGRAAEIGKPTR